MVQIQQGRIVPEYLLDIKGLGELKAIEYSPKYGLVSFFLLRICIFPCGLARN